MRTTVRLDPEVAAAAQRLQQERNIGLGEAVNELAKAGLSQPRPQRTKFRQQTLDLGLTIDVSDVADALEQLDNWDALEASEGQQPT